MSSVEWRGHLAAGLATLTLMAAPAGVSAAERARTAPAAQDTLRPRLVLMLRAMRIARDWHVEAPGRPVLLAGAIEGMLARLDPEAEFYTREDLRRIARYAPTGRAGIGVTVAREPAQRRLDRKGYRIVATRDDSPAARAGLKPGDVITSVEGEPAGDIPYLMFTTIMLEGPPGSRVHLTVERSGETTRTDAIVLERKQAAAPGVRIEEIVPGIVRVRIPWIGADTAEILMREWSAFAASQEAAEGLRGIVLDLRNTAAGPDDSGGALADEFLQSGVLFRTVARHRKETRQVKATSGDILGGRPVVLLVDAGTAGAAEMLASALHDGGRARLVGTRTAGRGAVRTLVPLHPVARKGVLRLTTSRLVTPSGEAIEGHGLAPDVVIAQLPASPDCRTMDIADESAPGQCVPRGLAEDSQLQRAVSLLDEPIVASEDALSRPKP